MRKAGTAKPDGEARVLTIRWLPRDTAAWKTFTESRREAARLWNRMARIHRFIRKRGAQAKEAGRSCPWSWPSETQFRHWASRRKFPNLHSQSVQEIINEFVEAVKGTTTKRKRGYKEAYYPKCWPPGREGYRDVPYKNNQARVRDGRLILPNCASGDLAVRLPDGVEAEGKSPNWTVRVWRKHELYLEGRLSEARLSYGVLRLVLRVAKGEAIPDGPIIGVDLGVNTLVAATDGETVILESGRQTNATVYYRNKTLGSISEAQSHKHKGSRRWKALQRRKRQMLQSCRNQVDDRIHKATRAVADEFPGAVAYVGRPFNEAAQRIGRMQAQKVSQACNKRIIDCLKYKLKAVEVIEEHYTSQTCPRCGSRSKHGRVYRCPACGETAPRDVIGATNIRDKGVSGEMAPGRSLPETVKYRRPV